MSLYAIRGIQAGAGPNGEIPIRREIDEWWFSSDKNDFNQKSLFILAMINFQKRGLEDYDDLGYLGIAGIHGLPLEEWPKTANSGNYQTAYCHHVRWTFNTWHTPYMLLIEQRIYEEMLDLIPHEYIHEEQEEMKRAADTWRFPFWDWARRKPDWDDSDPNAQANHVAGVGPNVPFLTTQKRVQVRSKLGEAIEVDNPMYQFKVPKAFENYGVGGKTEPWTGKVQATSHQPKVKRGDWNSIWNKMSPEDRDSYTKGLYQDYRVITDQLRGSVKGEIPDPGNGDILPYFANTLPEGVYRLFASVDDGGNAVAGYEQFASSVFKYGQQPTAYPSMEGLHNTLHDYIGGMGFMSEQLVSSFDPIFWLFHFQCDRLLAIWQELFQVQYKAWLDSDSNQVAYGPKTELAPFLDANLKPFNSITCSYKYKEFNYTYPELQFWKYEDQASHHAAIKAELERLYASTPKLALTLDVNAKAAKVHMEAMKSANLSVEYFPPQLAMMAPETIKPLSADEFQSCHSRPSEEHYGEPPEQTWQNNDYLINVVYQRFALNGLAYSITFFLGDVPIRDAPDGEVSLQGDYNFKKDESAISRVYNFVSPLGDPSTETPRCSNCVEQAEAGTLCTGQVILTDFLIERIAQQVELRGLKLQTLNEDEVVEYLKKNLHWRISDRFGKIIPKEQIPSLKISVAMGTATHYSGASKSSKFGNYKVLWDVTQGRLGGAAPGDI